jgi:putative resolvase
MKYVKLNKAAELYNVHYRTILNWAKEGKIQYITTPSGARHYAIPNCEVASEKIVGYVRVSSYSQKQHLKSQSELLLSQYPTAEVISEVATGLNFRRKELWNIVERAIAGDITTLVVTHKDRLSRFGFEFIQQLLGRFGCKVMVLNQVSTSPEEELVQDILSIINVFSSRLYGLRKYKDEFKSLSSKSEQGTAQIDKELDEDLQVSL